MANLTAIDKMKLETLFEMNSGYVLDFSNSSFSRFIYDSVRVNVDTEKYSTYGSSKANRLRALWQIEGDITVGKLIEDILAYLETQSIINKSSGFNQKLFDECNIIALKLQGKKVIAKTETTDDFLDKELDEIDIRLLNIDSMVAAIIEQRMAEIKKCLKSEASLSVIFLCGSVLEGVLLSIAVKNTKEFNQSVQSPKHRDTGKVKQFHEWNLSTFIDVAYDTRFIGLDVKKYSHSLRDFRNYIHPYEQMSSGFNPDKHTAEICWKVLKAAIHDIYEKQNK